MRPPGNEEGRALTGSAASRVDNPDEGFDASIVRRRFDAVAEMRALVNDLDHHRGEVADAYRSGYADGFTTGQEIGYGRRCHEEATEWQALAKLVHRAAQQRMPAELAALDAAYAAGKPCTAPHSSGCSRCVRAAAVARRGGDYQGGPVDWEPRGSAREVA